MGLQAALITGELLSDDLAGQQHTTGLAPYGTAPRHPVPEQKIVPGLKIPAQHFLEPPVLCHGALHDLPLCLPAEAPLAEGHPGRGEKAVMAVQALILLLGLFLLQDAVVAAQGHAVLHRPQSPVPRVPGVREEHFCRVAVPHLQGMDVVQALSPVHIQKNLGRVPYPGHGVKGVASPEQGKAGHGIQAEQVRAGDPEEISHHQVRVPHGLELGEAVKNVKRLSSIFRNAVVDVNCKSLKPLVRIELPYLQPRAGPEQGLMAGKSHIDDCPPVSQRLFREGLCKTPELVQALYPPHNIVPKPDIVEKPVYIRKPA